MQVIVYYIVDSTIRWLTVYQLKSSTTKSACDAVMETPKNVGIPSAITSDHGTNCIYSQRAMGFMHLNGCNLRLDMQGIQRQLHNGRWVKSDVAFKKLIHHVNNQGQWGKIIPFTVCVQRE